MKGIAILIVISFAFVFPSRAERTDLLFDRDPDHLWNRLHRALFIRAAKDGREYGFDSLDPLYWSATKHLLEGESHTRALRVLDEFIEKRGERLIADPLKRAILQRDLWALFDWASARNRYEEVPFHPAEVRTLSARLATIIRRLALTKEQIASLPDNYAAALASKTFPGAFDFENPEASFLPSNLFQKDGPWVCVETQQGPLPAPVHTQEFGGRSAFAICINLPKGREETMAYLEKLGQFAEPWIFDKGRMEEKDHAQLGAMLTAMPHSFDPKRGPWVNPDLPQFPDGTKVALVRQVMLIDREGRLVPTHLTESVQLRVYLGINPVRGDGGEQSVFEFKLSRPNLFAAKAGGLRAIEKEEKDFSIFLVHGIDSFELELKNPDARINARGAVLNCMTCHDGAGIHSVLSHSRLFSPPTLRPPEYRDSSPERIAELTASWKRDQFSWGMLKGLWQSEH